MRSPLAALAAILVGAVPRRYWAAIDLPLSQFATPGGLVTLVAGCAFGITGYFAHMAQVMESAFFVPSPYMMVGYFGYLFFTPRGLFSIYLVGSGLARAVSGWIDEPFGDPILTGGDSLVRHLRGTAVTRTTERERLAAEGANEPDRRYPAAWADVPGADFVIVAARRKAGWTPGTFVITDEGWFTLGQSFDRPTPNGLRTIYPLTVLQTLEVLRKGVPYDMPPLRPYPPRRRGPVAEPLPP
ncbi:MAG: hypothetical protein Q8L75_06850, partial [Acidobacteriota bacterium]|nr:hypothetical protein [Acidobacteriota bacterium]